MTKKKGMPTVVIVGRTNVGKSTLFNRLSTDVKSLTLDYEGVTRDFLSDIVCWRDRSFELIDTGGISFRKTQDPILQKSRERALQLIDEADLILFVCDGTVGVQIEDREISDMLHAHNKNTVLVINKVDSHVGQERQYEFSQLGYKNSVAVSAQHGTAIADLFDEILDALPGESKPYEEEDVSCKVVILGRPNVGKSSLMNLLVGQERSIVTAIEGTTREAISENITFYKEIIEVTDTPGVRRKRGVTEPLEQLMVKSALHTLDRADVVLLVIDVSNGRLVDQELKLAFYAFQEKYKGLIIIFNKNDLETDAVRKELEYNLAPYQYFLKNIVQLHTSCVTQKNVGKVISLVNEVCNRYRTRFDDHELTTLFKQALERRPLYKSESLLHVYRAQQVKTGPITIALVVNEAKWFGPSQISYFEHVLREHTDLRGVPVRFVIRKKNK